MKEISEDLYLGLMSGTSADGVDAALVSVSSPHRGSFSARLLDYREEPFPAGLGERIRELAYPGRVVRETDSRDLLDLLLALDQELGLAFTQAARNLMSQAAVHPDQVRAIGLHGQTVRHRPPSRIGEFGRTLQIGAPAILVEQLQIPVVCDFRSRDMALGGQGAPLVPMVDRLLFEQEGVAVAALNLGGIANISWLPPKESREPMVAMDTGPANAWIDAACRWGGIPEGFDREGSRARRGRLDETLFEMLLGHPYFSRQAPKSTGLEEFGESQLLPHLEGRDLDSVLHTLVRLTARTVTDALKRLEASRGPISAIYVSGGGRKNSFLMECMEREMAGLDWLDTAEKGVPSDSKEAFAFAILAARTLHGLPGNVPEVTGATRSTVLGSLLWPSGSVPSGG